MRRKDREMPEDFALFIVDKCEYAVMATTNKDGSPYCVPLSIVREENNIYFHCAHNGQKIENLKNSAKVCIACIGDVKAMESEFSTEYESAIVFGIAKEVEIEMEKIRALKLLSLKYTSKNMHNFDKAIAKSLKKTAIWRVEITQISGKRKKYDKFGKEMKFCRKE